MTASVFSARIAVCYGKLFNLSRNHTGRHAEMILNFRRSFTDL